MRQVKVLALPFAFALVLALAAAVGPASAQVAGPEALGLKKHFSVEITNPSKLTLENHAVVIDVAEIRATAAPDFNTYMYMFFEVKGPEFIPVVSQPDDLDKDRYHDEIVLVRTLPAASTTKLVCYYTPNKGFQVMPPQKAYARGPWQTGGAEAGWESNLVTYDFVHGAIGVFGKLQPGLVLKGFPASLTKSQDWGMAVIDPGASAGAGGLSLWDGAQRLPLFGAAAPQAKLTVISPGPLRGLVKAEYPPVKTAAGEVTLTVYLSAFADNIYSRQDVVISAKAGTAVVFGPGLQKLPNGGSTLDQAKGVLSMFGKGADKSGSVGLAAIFAPSQYAGVDDSTLDRCVKLAGKGGGRLTFWLAGAWDRGMTATDAGSGKDWARRAGDLAARLLVPVKVEFKTP